MKKLLAVFLAALLVSAALCVCLTVSAEDSDVRFETFELTALNETVPEANEDGEIAWYADGIVVAVTNDGSSEKTIAAGDYALRYLFILVFDGEGSCVEIGNNLFSADDPRANEFPQHDVVIPAGGFVILFYYNNDNPTNKALYDFYDDLGGSVIYNETLKISPKYSAAIEKNSVVIYFGAKPAASETSSEAPSETSPEDSSAAPAESSAPAATSSTAPATSSSAPATSSSTSKVPTGDAGMIGFAVLAVVAIAGVAVAVKVRH